MSGRTTLSGYLTEKEPTPLPHPDLPSPSYALEDPESMDVDDPQWIGGIPDESEPMSVIQEVAVGVPPESHDPEDDQPVLLSELWQAISTSRQQRIDGTRDLFGELRTLLPLARHVSPCQCLHPLCPRMTTMCVTQSLISALSFLVSIWTQSGYVLTFLGPNVSDDQPDEISKLSPDSPTYPWPTREVG